MLDYSSVDWSSIVDYSETSPSGLVWVVDRGKMKYGDVAGSRSYAKDKNPKCWDLRYDGHLWKAHRIIWILINGKIENDLVINHIDNNPFNNSIDNLEQVTQIVNMRRTSCHTKRQLQIDNGSGVTGVSEIIRDGKIYGYSAFVRDSHGKIKVFTFSVARYGMELAMLLATNTREYLLKVRNEEGAGYA